MSETPTRADAWVLLTKFTDNPSLIKHALGVEAAMRAYARSFGEDEEMWGTIGLVHDFDYQQNPTEETHLHVGIVILREHGWPEDWIQTIASHADYMGVARDTVVRKTLFAVDELSGFLTACALVRPDKAIASSATQWQRSPTSSSSHQRSRSTSILPSQTRRQGTKVFTKKILFVFFFVSSCLRVCDGAPAHVWWLTNLKTAR
jgi:putative nucleotidyltransferase with HDIG domain